MRPDPMEDRDLRALPTSLDGVWTDIPRLHFAGAAALPPILRPDVYYLFTGDARTAGERLAPSLPAVQYP